MRLPVRPPRGSVARRKLVWVISLIGGTYLIRDSPGTCWCRAGSTSAISHSVQSPGAARQLLSNTGEGMGPMWRRRVRFCRSPGCSRRGRLLLCAWRWAQPTNHSPSFKGTSWCLERGLCKLFQQSWARRGCGRPTSGAPTRGHTRRGHPGDAACTPCALLPDQTPLTRVPQQAGLGAGEQSPIRAQETIHARRTPHRGTLGICRDPHTPESHPVPPGAIEDTAVKTRPCPKVSSAGSGPGAAEGWGRQGTTGQGQGPSRTTQGPRGSWPARHMAHQGAFLAQPLPPPGRGRGAAAAE